VGDRRVEDVMPERPPAVVIDDVSVRYRLTGGASQSLRGWLVGRGGAPPLTVHDALRGVSVQVPHGGALGVIGSNGSGKTTLLRLIARVVEPTSGRVRVRGRIAPMFDLVAGFHPEMSGRDNILVHGTLLGLRRQEILKRMDSIVDFAEIGAFIDAPLRTYSAGMMLRVGFAVTTAIDPDILIIDEVLGVGDEKFQRKCAERIGQLRAGGATFVLVSHDLQSVQRLCSQALWLDRGTARAFGPVSDVVEAYLADRSS
jgi:lipopolysaccharide transport system ATP-binding protein